MLGKPQANATCHRWITVFGGYADDLQTRPSAITSGLPVDSVNRQLCQEFPHLPGAGVLGTAKALRFERSEFTGHVLLPARVGEF